MGIDEGLRDQIASCVDFGRPFTVEAFGDRHDAAVTDADLDQSVALAPESCATDRDIKCVSHDRSQFESPSSTGNRNRSRDDGLAPWQMFFRQDHAAAIQFPL